MSDPEGAERLPGHICLQAAAAGFVRDTNAPGLKINPHHHRIVGSVEDPYRGVSSHPGLFTDLSAS